jgi:hypothetical protein
VARAWALPIFLTDGWQAYPAALLQVGGVSVGDHKVLAHPSCLYAEQKHLSIRRKRLSRTQVCIRSGRYGGRGPSKAYLEGALRDPTVLLILNTLHSCLHGKDRILYNAAKDVSPETDAKLQELKQLIAANTLPMPLAASRRQSGPAGGG